MSQPPESNRTPAPGTGSDALTRLTALGRDAAGTRDPVIIAGFISRALREMLALHQLVVVLVEPNSGNRWIASEHNYAKARADHPLVDAALRGPSILDETFLARLAPDAGTGGWMGAPIQGASGRLLGAACVWASPGSSYGPDDLSALEAILVVGAIALAHARLLDLLSTGKREWEQTVDAIGEAFCVLDESGTVRRANRAFSELTHTPLTSLAGAAWSSLLPDAWITPVAQVLAVPDSGSVDLPSGERLFTVSALPIGAAGQRNAVLVFADQTEKRRLQEQLVQSEKMSAIGQLIAGVAHDLNNPLASVVGFADYLVESEKDAPPHLREPLRAIQQEAERAANIVRNLLTFARKQDRRRRTQPIGPILEATLLLLRNQLMACKVESHLEIAPGLPDVTVDANQVQQVFVNLINNAAQAIQGTGQLGNVWVRASQWLDGIAVMVEDDGPGIPNAIAGKIFEPFFTTKPEGQGTGLGLSICHGIVAEHGGRIMLGKRDGRGATLRVELPGGAVPRAAAPEEARTLTGALKILLVDDEPHILHYMQATLEAWGHAVVLAGDGEEALAQARTGRFDVIISDIRMPRVGGREFYETLLRERHEIASRVVFSTGDTVRGDTLAFLESLGRPYLHKPFTLGELRAALGRAMADGRTPPPGSPPANP